MTCREDVLPLFVVLSLLFVVLLFLIVLKEYLFQGGYKKDGKKFGMPWNVKDVASEAEDINSLKERYGSVMYYIGYVYVFLMNELFNHSIRSLVVGIVLILVASRLLLVYC